MKEDDVFLTTLLNLLDQISEAIHPNPIGAKLVIDQLRIRIVKQIRELQKEEAKA